MAIKRDYKCEDHGFFEAWEHKCPQCAKTPSIVILRAPTMRDSVAHGRSQRNDTNLKRLASEFKMTDIKSTREGEHQTGYLTRNNEKLPEEARPDSGLIWGGDKRFNMHGILNGQIKPVRDEKVGFSPRDANITQGPRTASYIADHENLAIKKDD